MELINVSIGAGYISMEKIMYPGSVELCEVGPRDGFQFEETPIPTALKIEIIRALSAAGLPRIQATSFVHPRWVPQMADAEEVLAAVSDLRDSTIISALILNVKGLERAIASGVEHVDLSIATNEQHSADNANMTVQEGIRMAEDIIDAAVANDMSIQMGFQTVFGYRESGDTDIEFVADLVKEFAAKGVESISLADSTGLANPVLMKKYLETLLPLAGTVPVVLHLHDTRGLGLANVVAALECGVTRYDTSLGGLGGCPFIPGATGNIATEDMVHLCDSLGIQTGVALARVAACSRRMETHRGQPLPGKLYSLQ